MIELSNCSYDRWLEFVFEHPVQAMTQGDVELGMLPEPWHFDPEWEYSLDSATAISHMQRLFEDASALPERFSVAQIDQGFWFIPGPNGFTGALLDRSVAITKRDACIRAIPELYFKLFSRQQIGTSPIMWWDSFITYSAFEELDLATEPILTSVIAVVRELQQQPSEIARAAAGIGIKRLLKLSQTAPPAVGRAIQEALGAT
jgi:hypothetical protein